MPAHSPSSWFETSTGLTPAATTSTSSSSGPISGTGTCSSRSTSGPPNSRTTIARMLSAS